MAEEFMGEYPNVNVTVDSTGVRRRFRELVLCGRRRRQRCLAADNGRRGRTVRAGNDVDPVEFQVASDALTVAVNNEADWVDCMTFDELRQIWREGGVELWSDVRDEWPDREIEAVRSRLDLWNLRLVQRERRRRGHPAHDGIPADRRRRDHRPGHREQRRGRWATSVSRTTTRTPRAVKAIEIEQESGDGCSAPNLENARDGSYPMARPLFVYAAESSLQREEVATFLEYYLENAETDLVSDIGYVPASAELRDENLQTLEEATAD